MKISVYDLLAQVIGHPAYRITNPVLDLTEFRYSQVFDVWFPVKSASAQYMKYERSPMGLNDITLSMVPIMYLHMCCISYVCGLRGSY